MVLTRNELVKALRQEVNILVHLAGKVDAAMLDYRPTPKQRSTLELLQYMAIMGPTQIAVIKQGIFDRPHLSAAWTPADALARAMTFEQTVAAIAAQSEHYATQLASWTDDELRTEIDMFGSMHTRGALVVSLILNSHAAYRMQLFLYLKSCGREELNTVNLWAGVDRM